MGGVCHLKKNMSNRKSNQLSCWQASPANTRWVGCYYDLISKLRIGLKSLLRQGLSEFEFYGDLVYKLKKIVGSNTFSAQFIKIIPH